MRSADDPAANPAIPAATLILIRDGAGNAPPDLLMIERTAAMAFAGGALVFPGGRVDPGDRLLAGAGAAAEDRAARIAAIRETIEETGVAVGLSPVPDADQVKTLRDALAAGGNFAALLAELGLTPEPAALVPFARWVPPGGLRRRFDTRFYLARAPLEAAPSPDGAETSATFWMAADAVLAAAARGEARLIFPTRRNLERLARFASFAEAEHDAARHPVTMISPWIERRDGHDWLCIPEGLGYPVTAERMAEPSRG